MEDPFDQVRSGVESTLKKAERQRTKWAEARRQKPVRHDECKKLLIELLSSLELLETDLEDLDSAVCAVEKARSRFSHLNDAVIESRQAFVRNSKRATASIRDEVSSHTPNAKKGTKARASLQEREGLLASPSPLATVRSAASHASAASGSSAAATPPVAGLAPALDVDVRHTARIDAELGQHAMLQQVQIEQQDDALEVLSGAVRRLKNMGLEINDELSSQHRMLNELGNNLDLATNTMDSLKGKMQTMMKSKDRGKFCAIFALTIVFFGLLMLVMS